jgi:hypothetical protein
MLFGVLNMPYEMAMNDEMSRYQFYQRVQEAVARMVIAEERVDKLLAHCDDPECWTCGKIICPHECEMHFHHDGCPACAQENK